MKEAIIAATKIYKELVDSEFGYIEKNDLNSEIFIDFMSDDVASALESMTEVLRVRIFKVQNRIYLFPLEDSVLSVSESDVAKYFYVTPKTGKRESDERLYLFYYITLVFLNEIYGGAPFRKLNDYCTLEGLVEAMNTSVERQQATITTEEEEDMGFNILAVGRKWKNFALTGGGNKDSKVNSMSSKLGFAERAMKYLKKQGLVDIKVQDNTRIYPERKLSDLILVGGLNMDRIEELKIRIQNDIYSDLKI